MDRRVVALFSALVGAACSASSSHPPQADLLGGGGTTGDTGQGGTGQGGAGASPIGAGAGAGPGAGGSNGGGTAGTPGGIPTCPANPACACVGVSSDPLTEPAAYAKLIKLGQPATITLDADGLKITDTSSPTAGIALVPDVVYSDIDVAVAFTTTTGPTAKVGMMLRAAPGATELTGTVHRVELQITKSSKGQVAVQAFVADGDTVMSTEVVTQGYWSPAPVHHLRVTLVQSTLYVRIPESGVNTIVAFPGGVFPTKPGLIGVWGNGGVGDVQTFRDFHLCGE